MKLSKWNMLFFSVVMLLTGYVILKAADLEALGVAIRGADRHYLYLGLLCMVMFWGIEAGILDILLKKADRRIRFWTSLKTALIGQYYSFLTPFASGGQPAQILTLARDRVPAGSATAVLVSKFLIFQISVTAYSFLLLVTHLKYFTGGLEAAVGFIAIGLSLNTVGLAFITLAAFKPVWLQQIIDKTIDLLSKFRIVRSEAHVRSQARQHLEEYHAVIETLKNDLRTTLGMFAMTFVQLTLLFSITYFVYRSLGLSGATLMQIVTLQALLYMAVSFIPVPGTAGVSEIGFSLILGSVFSANIITVAVLLWRGISFYFGLLFCGLFTLYVYIYEKQLLKFRIYVK
ncbi:MAG: lysylphosphatidylglycerol synthase transmembrane domain-containing protein [Erysipelotrichaceae bacterium]|nr:lysylphosphatidylglycerol synthase transmembrane domain-containing protein [Erysipelotrichaceae bacterium]